MLRQLRPKRPTGPALAPELVLGPGPGLAPGLVLVLALADLNR